MPKRRQTIPDIPSIPRIPDPPKYPTVTFGNKEFEIHPFSARTDDFVYDDSARFLITAVPVGSKVYNQLFEIQSTNPAAIDRLAKGVSENDDVAAVAVARDLMTILSNKDTKEILEEVFESLPKLAAIACHYTDPDVTEDDIRGWVKSSLDPNLWRAVIEQFKVEKIMEQIGSISGVVKEFGGA